MNLLAHYRRIAQIKQTDLAEEAGLSQSAISHYEKNFRLPYEDCAKTIVAVLNKYGVECDVKDVFPFFEAREIRKEKIDARRQMTRFGIQKKLKTAVNA